ERGRHRVRPARSPAAIAPGSARSYHDGAALAAARRRRCGNVRGSRHDGTRPGSGARAHEPARTPPAGSSRAGGPAAGASSLRRVAAATDHARGHGARAVRAARDGGHRALMLREAIERRVFTAPRLFREPVLERLIATFRDRPRLRYSLAALASQPGVPRRARDRAERWLAPRFAVRPTA